MKNSQYIVICFENNKFLSFQDIGYSEVTGRCAIFKQCLVVTPDSCKLGDILAVGKVAVDLWKMAFGS